MTGRAGYAYIMASRRNGTLYIGSTIDLVCRTWQHRQGAIDGFGSKHGCKILVWFATFDDIIGARAEERRLKKWNRAWKLRLIEENNPQWRDMYLELVR